MSSGVNCCLSTCRNTYGNTTDVSFYSFPNRSWETERRKLWINFVKRINVDGTPWVPSKFSCICSQHFVGNDKSKHPLAPNFNPTIRVVQKSAGEEHQQQQQAKQQQKINRFKRLQVRRSTIIPVHKNPILSENDRTRDPSPPPVETEEEEEEVNESINKTTESLHVFHVKCLVCLSPLELFVNSSDFTNGFKFHEIMSKCHKYLHLPKSSFQNVWNYRGNNESVPICSSCQVSFDSLCGLHNELEKLTLQIDRVVANIVQNMVLHKSSTSTTTNTVTTSREKENIHQQTFLGSESMDHAVQKKLDQLRDEIQKSYSPTIVMKDCRNMVLSLSSSKNSATTSPKSDNKSTLSFRRIGKLVVCNICHHIERSQPNIIKHILNTHHNNNNKTKVTGSLLLPPSAAAASSSSPPSSPLMEFEDTPFDLKHGQLITSNLNTCRKIPITAPTRMIQNGPGTSKSGLSSVIPCKKQKLDSLPLEKNFATEVGEGVGDGCGAQKKINVKSRGNFLRLVPLKKLLSPTTATTTTTDTVNRDVDQTNKNEQEKRKSRWTFKKTTKGFECSSCDLIEPTQNKIVQHILQTHHRATTTATHPKLPSLVKPMKQGYSLYRNKWRFRRIDKGFECHYCELVVTDRMELFRHLDTHQAHQLLNPFEGGRPSRVPLRNRYKNFTKEVEPDKFLYRDKWNFTTTVVAVVNEHTNGSPKSNKDNEHHDHEGQQKSGDPFPPPPLSDTEDLAVINYKFTCGSCEFMVWEKVKMMRHLEGHHYQETISTKGPYKPPEEVEVPGLYRPSQKPKQSLDPNKQNRKESPKHVDQLICEQCGKIFRTSHSLKLHYKAHSDLRNFVCHVCGNSYKAGHNLNNHLRKLHPENQEEEEGEQQQQQRSLEPDTDNGSALPL